ncbi:PKD domain-containing protein [Archaeoglobus profundus]|uniref:PKD domain containing protein n=1 Tax=Archaeoglobus profundus (strain DSM 5631 / JCM 9629 / NBRC 100127 / Av18) TaxID=572546 RepID=D2RFN2_ARCPA|nr:PKD domain-containing protein [Archaeoglobus profundus]ADB57107.1 PKD domain containing protein [Archaeoglobus profundus DSM 5631]
MDSKGVTPLIGFILLLLIGMVFLSLVQTKLVPSILKDVEMKHMNKVIEEIYEFDRDVIKGEEGIVSFDLGVEYPNYLFLMTPTTGASSISIEQMTINVSGEIRIDDRVINKLSYNTNRITVGLNYFANPNYKIIYENTAIFKMFDHTIMVSGEQKMFCRRYVNIYMINTSFSSISSNRPTSVVIVPISVPKDVGGAWISNANLTFKSVYPEYWNSTLKGLNYSVDVNESNGTISATLKNVTLRVYYLYVMTGVGLSAEQVEEAYRSLRSETLHPSYVVRLNPSEITLSQGESIVLGVRVLDQYFNPMGNVNLSVSASGGSVNPQNAFTNERGEAYFTFTASNAGTATVKIECVENKSVSVTYTIKVTPVGSAPCPYSIKWNVNSYDWNVSLEGNTKSFFLHAEYENSPLIGANIDLSKNSTIVAIPDSVTTNESGDAEVSITANDNGSVAVVASYSCAYAILHLNIYGFGINEQPVAIFTYTPSYPAVGEVITFDASSSYDPDGVIVEYRWDFGDGNAVTTTSPTVTHTYSNWGAYKVTLTVVDNGSLVNSTSVWIWVGDLIYNNDALALDGPDSPWPRRDRAGGVEFTITNRFNTTVEIDYIYIEPQSAQITTLSDEVFPNNQPRYCEVYVDASIPSYVDYYGGTSLPVKVDLGVSGDENSGTDAYMNADSTAKIYLYEFYNRHGGNIDMSGETIYIEIGYSANGEHKVKSFTITPQ